MKKIVVLGSGFIASHLRYEIINHRFTLDENKMYDFIRNLRADVIINTIGATGGNKNIDWCEKNKIATYTSNVVIPLMLAEACARRDMHMVHIGSGCIYYGDSPNCGTMSQLAEDSVPYKHDFGWKETDHSNATSYYSKTKAACDLALGSLPNTAILRIRMPISTKDHPRNLLNKLIGYEKVVEEPNSMTFMSDLVNAIDYAIDKQKTGIYHIVSSKPLTHSVLLEEYKKYVPAHAYTRISKEELDTMVAAPRSNCILDCNKTISEGFKFGDIDQLVIDTVKEFAKNKGLI